MPQITSPSQIEAALERGLEGRGIGRDDALALMAEAPLGALLHAAAALRDRTKGRPVSYSRKVFIPLTHLCRDYCGYCTFRSDPQPGQAAYMTADEVLAVAEAGRRAGCKEALFSLGDQPETIFPEAKAALKKLGYHTTLEYLSAMCELVLTQTGLLPHSNPGVMPADDLRRLRESNVSAGLMLESASLRLTRIGGPHWKAPDKVPALRLRTLEAAGRMHLAFTTGILIGIGETPEERVDALLAIRDVHEKYGHIQEIIVQPFRSKPETRMDLAPEPTHQDLQRTIAVARLLLGGQMNIQSPPNLLSRDYPELLKAGINDWGGISPVTKDFINPEAAWPQISSLAQRTAEAGFVLRERLAIYPEFSGPESSRRAEFVVPRLDPHLRKLQGSDGYAAGDSSLSADAPANSRDRSLVTLQTGGSANVGGRSFSSNFSVASPAALAAEESGTVPAKPESLLYHEDMPMPLINESWRDITWDRALRAATSPVAAALEKVMSGGDLDYDQGLLLAKVDGNDLIALIKVADELRHRTVGDHITYVVNRNLNFTNVCIVGCAFCGFGRTADAPDAYFHSTETLVAKAVEAAELGATEVCIQGGLPRDLDGNYYVSLLRALKARLPQLHIHAYSPMEITYGVEKTRQPLRDFLLSLKEAGLNSIPGTAAEILDDDVRKSLSPNKLKVKQWVEVIRTAHSLGIPTTSTMMYGHTEQPEHWVRHLLLLRGIQKETGGFTEFVPLGFIHSQTKLFLGGRARAGHSQHEDLIVHALSRVLLHGHIRNIQVSWVKLGFADSLACLQAGANDFGGTLMEESISKAAGANWGEYVAPGEFRALIRTIGRIPAERATSYKLLKIFDQADAQERLPVERMQPQMPALTVLGSAPDQHHHAPASASGY